MSGDASTRREPPIARTGQDRTPWLDDGDVQLYHGDVCDVLRSLPAGVAQTCVTSPPYWGLRDYGTGDAQIGIEATPELYVERMVAVFREVWRVLRDDGTLWLNLGDSYAGSGKGGNPEGSQWSGFVGNNGRETAAKASPPIVPDGLKPKDLVGIPWRVAFALQDDGWYLRSDVVWAKPNPMPESVTDRPTKAHEYVFLLAKRPRYFYDADAVREAHVTAEDPRNRPDYQVNRGRPMPMPDGDTQRIGTVGPSTWPEAGRNLRSVWEIATEPFPEAHFATYPQALVRRCILAGTSERGECSACGAAWVREVERTDERVGEDRGGNYGGVARTDGTKVMQNGYRPGSRYVVRHRGWRPSCMCAAVVGVEKAAFEMAQNEAVGATPTPPPPVPQTVLDPFVGSGTTALVARKHGRRAIGIDLSAEYLAIASKRTQQLSLLGGAA